MVMSEWAENKPVVVLSSNIRTLGLETVCELHILSNAITAGLDSVHVVVVSQVIAVSHHHSS